jgi:hypothetical protein
MLGIKERIEGRTRKGVEDPGGFGFAKSVTKCDQWASALWI